MKLTAKREKLLVFVYALIYIVPVLVITWGMGFRMFSDYDATLPNLYFISEYVKKFLQLPWWNPYAGAGIPVIGDPASEVLNPLISLPVIFFGIDIGIRFIFIEAVTLTGFSMWLLLTRLKVKGWMRLWGACLYTSSGAMAARFAAGHIDQFFVYFASPLFIYSILSAKIKKWDLFLASVLLVMLFYSGTLYHIFYLAIFYIVVRGFYLILKESELKNEIYYVVSILFSFITLGFPKLFDFFRNTIPIMRKSISDASLGSLHLFLFPVQFMMPYGASFYDRPTVQRIFGYYYNWYEYFAFVSPLPFIFFTKWKLLLKKKEVQILFVLLAAGALYVSLGYFYSPFWWLYKMVPVLEVFRVPQRIYLSLTSVMVALIVIAGTYWYSLRKLKNITVIIMILSLAWTHIVSAKIIINETFEVKDSKLEQMVTKLRASDPGDYYAAVFVPKMQYL
ncbi:hypothetical protein ACFL1A_03560, partial [Patescibacteria group bacterium]